MEFVPKHLIESLLDKQSGSVVWTECMLATARFSLRTLVRTRSCRQRTPSNKLRCYSDRRIVKPFAICSAVTSMDEEIQEEVKRVHATSTQAVLYVTGGAVTALSWLISVPGASRTVLEAAVPYSSTSSEQLLKSQQTGSYSGLEQCKSFARAAYEKATTLTLPGEWDFVGIAATCALATDREKKGEHRCCVSVFNSKGRKSYSLTFEKGRRSRLEEEIVASRLLLLVLAEAVGIHDEATVRNSMQSHLRPAEQDALHSEAHELEDPVALLLEGSIRSVEYCGRDFVLDGTRNGALVLPGSFNPLHEGHLQMMKAAEEKTGRKGLFELSVGNPDKGILDIDTVRRRLEQFCSRGIPILLSRASFFVDKTSNFTNCTFVVGYDTAVRIVHPKYYGDSETNMAVMLEQIHNRGCKFLVAGRVVATERGKEFLLLKDMEVPSAFTEMFEGLDDFRLDISSTEIRQRESRE